MLRQFLIRLRKEYNGNKRRFFLFGAVIFVVSLAISLAVDALTPFESFWMILRSFLLLPLGASLFAIFYGISLSQHRTRKRENPEWTPYRMRFSPTWRRRISLIIAAFVFVLLYGSGFQIGYTLISSLAVTIVLALFAFMRTTKEESIRESLDLPDMRDVSFDKFRKAREEERREKSIKKARAKSRLRDSLKRN